MFVTFDISTTIVRLCSRRHQSNSILLGIGRIHRIPPMKHKQISQKVSLHTVPFEVLGYHTLQMVHALVVGNEAPHARRGLFAPYAAGAVEEDAFVGEGEFTTAARTIASVTFDFEFFDVPFRTRTCTHSRQLCIRSPICQD